ncbi:MAG TPA: carboxylesterase family protein, partial [Mycobacterium sp.]|nr:carboxylesterase family protein [Mycobacterium sp.]
MSTVVETAYGPVRGVDGGVRSWLGVRYGAPPTGGLRWRAPEPPQPWTDVADASILGPVCPQPVDPRIPIDLGAPQGDDCLTLNIWASSDIAAGDRKPVMVWIHGGAYVLGSANQPMYDGRVLAAGGDVVVVTVNYRLGAFGFLDLSSFSTPRRRFESNLGLRDVLHALHWIRDNIAAFGGDPDRVTVFGESAGSWSVNVVQATPLARGLLHRAIGESGAQFARTARLADAEKGGAAVASAVGADSLNALRAVPAEKLNTVQSFRTGVNVDGYVLPDEVRTIFAQKKQNDVPVLIGSNANEWTT